MKKLMSIIVILATLAISTGAWASVHIRYYNKDSKSYTAKAICSGSRYSVTFGSSRTASVTIQGSAPCKVTLNGKTTTFNGASKITIHNGVIKVN